MHGPLNDRRGGGGRGGLEDSSAETFIVDIITFIPRMAATMDPAKLEREQLHPPPSMQDLR